MVFTGDVIIVFSSNSNSLTIQYGRRLVGIIWCGKEVVKQFYVPSIRSWVSVLSQVQLVVSEKHAISLLLAVGRA